MFAMEGEISGETASATRLWDKAKRQVSTDYVHIDAGQVRQSSECDGGKCWHGFGFHRCFGELDPAIATCIFEERDQRHYSFIRFGPSRCTGRLYGSVGQPCRIARLNGAAAFIRSSRRSS